MSSCAGHLVHIRDQPFVLCVDQVDNLDHEKLKALVRFLQALLDHASNMLVIVSGVKQTLTGFQGGPHHLRGRLGPDRAIQGRAPSVRKDDARKILEARLERFHEPFMELDPVRRHLQEDTLFPLGRAWLDGQLDDAPISAPATSSSGPATPGTKSRPSSERGGRGGLRSGRTGMERLTVRRPPRPPLWKRHRRDGVPQGRGAGRPAPAATGKPATGRRQPGGPGARPAGAVPGRRACRIPSAMRSG